MQVKIGTALHERPGNATVQQILNEFGFDSLSTVVLCNGAPITEDQTVAENDVVEFIDAISGG